MKVILASASPRRQELLKKITDDFEVIPSNYEENIPENFPVESAAEFLAVHKAMDVAKDHKDALVIGCDTVVIVGNQILGKPKDREEAKLMLSILSGMEHKVITGVALQGENISLSFSEEVVVRFADLTEEEIDWYVSTGEPMDKAGAYGIQGNGSLFVEKIAGDYYSVMGLPVQQLYSIMKKVNPDCLKTKK